MRITESRLRKIIREELINHNNMLKEALLIEGFMQDMTKKIGSIGTAGIMVMMLSNLASANPGFISKMSEKVSEYQAHEIAKIKKLGIKSLEEDEKELRQALRKNFFGYQNTKYQYLQRLRLTGDDKLPNAAEIVNELVSIMEKTSGMTSRFGLVYKALRSLQAENLLKPSYDTKSSKPSTSTPEDFSGAYDIEPL